MYGKKNRDKDSEPVEFPAGTSSREYLATVRHKAGVVKIHGLVPLPDLAIYTSSDFENPWRTLVPTYVSSDVIRGLS